MDQTINTKPEQENIHESILDLIGNTPLVEISRYCKQESVPARLLVKLERNNPGGSSKDRIALAMIEDAERRGVLTHDNIIVELTSGNTGIGIAMVAAIKGYRTKMFMSSAVSQERTRLLEALGAEVVIYDDATTSTERKYELFDELAKNTPGAIQLYQMRNPANPNIHYQTTGPEIWRDTAGQVDILVAAFGTGGTLSGSGRYLKEQNPKIQVVLVEPTWDLVPRAGEPYPAQQIDGVHRLTGVQNEKVIPTTLDREVIDECVEVNLDQCFESARKLAATEGLLVGTSAGGALHVATSMAKQPENQGKTIVVVLPDTGERYLSTELFASNLE